MSQDEYEFISKPVYLNEHVELIRGANNEPMLYHQLNKKYIRISTFSLEVLKLMDGTNTAKDIANILQSEYDIDRDIFENIHDFLTTLRKSGVLNLEPLHEKGIKKVVNKISKKPMLSFPLVKSLDLINNRLLAIYRLLPRKFRSYFWYLLISGAITAYILFFIFGFSTDFSKVNWLLLIPIVISNLIIHELAHSVVTKGYGISIREAGVALLYYFLPVAYVDRTDTYRLKSKKSRIHIAIAGPYSDFVIGGMWALTATVIPYDGVSQFAQIVALVQLLFVFNNLNLLLPTDGYHAVEALVGELSLRRRALYYLFSVITFRSAPNYIALNKKKKFVYFTYSFVSLSYFLILVSGILILVKNELH
ncbi:hypothetical protein OBCHQ24_04740 [Oceanobacillus iheyensis]|nr:hypothetical protein OBCHQ24_04740 [Oceanobacillus iheyensis]